MDRLCLEIFGSDVGPLGSLDDSAGDALRFIPPAEPLASFTNDEAASQPSAFSSASFSMEWNGDCRVLNCIKADFRRDETSVYYM